jgi:hypothetical protein
MGVWALNTPELTTFGLQFGVSKHAYTLCIFKLSAWNSDILALSRPVQKYRTAISRYQNEAVVIYAGCGPEFFLRRETNSYSDLFGRARALLPHPPHSVPTWAALPKSTQ